MPYQSQNINNRPLRVFLCHSSNDKPAVRELYQKLLAEPWIQPWLDEEELYPGQDWNMEIEKAVEAADAIIVCLSNSSITKEGYVQREIRIALDYADYKPEGTLFIIPVRLEECNPPKRLARWQYADYFEGQRERGLQRLTTSLRKRAASLNLGKEEALLYGNEISSEGLKSDALRDLERARRTLFGNSEILINKNIDESLPILQSANDFNNKIILSTGMEFMCVPAEKFIMGSGNGDNDEKPQHVVDISYDYWIARFPITNGLYNVYAKANKITHPVEGWEMKKDYPVTYIKWVDAMAYCQWLNSLFKAELSSGLVLRLPTEAEWEKSARGTNVKEFSWGNEFDKNKCNTREGGKGSTTSVGLYSPHGDSPYGCADMLGNVWEWTHSLKKDYPYEVNDGREDENNSNRRVRRGGSFVSDERHARCAYRGGFIFAGFDSIGFRVCIAPPLPK